VLHLFAQVFFWAGNQGSTHPCYPKNFDFHRDEAKKIQNGKLKKEISEIGPWVGRIN
jgi:hypothetical protein